MAMTKNEKYAVEMYIRYFGETPTNDQIAEYAEFGKAKLILDEIIRDAGLKNANMSKDEQINDLFINLFGRPAFDSELTKYKVKYLDKDKALPINSIIKAAKKGSSDKAVWDTKKAVALFIAEKGSATNIDLDKITKDTYAEIYNPKTKKLLVNSVEQLEAKIDAIPDNGSTPNVPGETFTLTNSTIPDTIVGKEKNDLITGTTKELGVDDRIVDSSIKDHDTFNLVATTNPVAMNVMNIEAINIDWQAFGTPTIDLKNVVNGTVTLSSEKQGYLGNANFTNVDRNNVNLGDGIIGKVSVAGTVDSTINAGNAKTLTVTNADRDLTVNANNSETVTISGAAPAANDVDNLTVSATNATALTVDANRSADITVGKNADLTMTGTADYTIKSTADVQLDVVGGAAFDTLTIAGDNAVTLRFAQAADIAGQTIANAGVIRLVDALAATVDYTDIEASKIVFENTADSVAGTAVTTVNGANFVVEADLAYATTFAVLAADDTTADEITVTLQDDQTAALNFNFSATTDFETVNIIGDAEVDATAGVVDLTIEEILAGKNKVVLSSEVNDIKVKKITAAEVDASAVTGNLDITETTTSADMLIIGGKAKNTVVFKTADKESTFVGNATSNAIDDIKFDTTTGDAVAMVYGGNNVVDAAKITDGQLTVVAGSGNDTVTAKGGAGATLKNGTLSLQLGDGNNSVTFGMAAARTGATVSIITGTGNDSIEITTNTKAKDDITIDLGTGSNTLKLSNTVDISLGTITLDGIDIIEVGATTGAGVSNATVNTADFTGKTFTVTSVNSDGAEDDTITFVSTATTAETIDLSNATIDQTITNALANTIINAGTGASTITGTSIADVIDAKAGADTVYMTDGADTVKLGASDTHKDTVIFTGTAAAESGALAIADVATANTLADTDTVARTGIDSILEFEINVDKIDLSAYSLKSGTVVQSGADAAGTLSVGDGEYGILRGTDVSGTFTVNSAAGTDTLLIWDADTTTGVKIVGVWIDAAVIDADDLIL